MLDEDLLRKLSTRKLFRLIKTERRELKNHDY